MKAVIIMGSQVDLQWSKKIAAALEKFAIASEMRIASAHKTPLKALEIIREYEDDEVVFITVAGRSNALSGFVDAHTVRPVIACPPYSESFGGADIFSTLRMPSGVAPLVVLEPEQAALAAAKILGMREEVVKKRIKEYQDEKRKEIENADKEIKGNG